MKARRISTIAAAVATTVVVGCSTPLVKDEIDAFKKEAASVDTLLAQGRSGEAPHTRRAPAVTVHPGAWVPVREFVPEDLQPGFEQGQRNISINRSFRDIRHVSERVTQLMGLPVSVSNDALNATGTGANAAKSAEAAAAGPEAEMAQLFGLPAIGIQLTYTGPLSGFMDLVASRFGVEWRWGEAGRSIEIYRLATQTFRITALPGDTALSASVMPASGGGSGEGGSSSGGAQETSVSFSGLSVWKAMEEAIKTMLSADGKVIASPALGTITVTDTPRVLREVEAFIKQQNVALAKQVVINVKVLSVDIGDSNNYGINWEAVYRSLSRDYGLSFASSFAPPVGASSMSARVISGAMSDMSQRWGDSSAIVNALSTQGHVSQVTSAAVTTLNNQPAPVTVGREKAYLASSSTTISEGVTTTTLEPGVVNTGFSMNLVPHIADNDSLILQYGINLSSLAGLELVTSGNASIQTPEREKREVMQRVRLNSGDTLVVAGFEQSNLETEQKGVGSAANMLLGGSVKGDRSRNALVILLQPVVVK